MAVAVSNTDLVKAEDFTSTTTIAGVSFGAEASDRIVGLWVYNFDALDGAALISDLSIGGVSANRVLGASQHNGTDEELAFYWALVPSGTTGDIEIAVSQASASTVLVNVFRITGADTTTPVSDANKDDTADNPLASITIPDNGALLAGSSAARVTSYPLFVGWVGATSSGSNSATALSAIRMRLESASDTASGNPDVLTVWTSALGETYLGVVAFQETQAQPSTLLFNQQLRY